MDQKPNEAVPPIREVDSWNAMSVQRSLSARLAASEARVQKLVSALESAQAGLQWYRDRYPAAVDGSDDEMDAQIEDALRAAGPVAEDERADQDRAGS